MLLSAYAGSIKAALQGCIRIKDPKLGYEQAFATLDEEYGDKETYISELVNKVLHGATMSWNGIQGLKDLVHDLVNCITNLQYLRYLREIDTQG